MTIGTESGMQVVSTDDVVVIAQDVWVSFLDLQLEPVPGGAPAPAGGAGVTMSGVVGVLDTWTGYVVLECTEDTARAMAAAMFRTDGGGEASGDVADALGELTNMIGGNVKSLLPAPSRLSLPRVHSGVWRPAEPTARLVNRVDFVSGPTGSPVGIGVWQV